MPAPLDFRALFDRSPNPYMLLDTDLVFVGANEAYLRVTGRRLDSVIGRHVFDAFPEQPEQTARLAASIEHAIATGETDTIPLIRYAIPRERPDGTTAVEERVWTATHTPLRGDDGAVAYVLQHAIDITELHRLREAARQAPGGEAAPAGGASVEAETGGPVATGGASDGVVFERAEAAQREKTALGDEVRRLRSVFDQAPAFLCSLEGPDHVFRYVNEAYLDLVGPRALLGLAVRAAVPEVEGQGYVERLDRVYATGETFRGEGLPVRLHRTPGGPLEERLVDVVFGPLRGDDGRVRGVLVHGVDATESVRARRAADELRGVNDLLLAHSPDVLAVLDADGRFVHVGAASTAVFGYTPDEMTGRVYSDLLHPDDHAAYAAEAWHFYEGMPLFTVENRYVHRDGSTVYMEWSASWPEGSPGLLAVGRDVTARHAQTAALRESHARLSTLVASMDQGFALCELIDGPGGEVADFRYLSVNAAFGEVTGIAGIVPGQTAREVTPELEDGWIEMATRAGRGRERLRTQNRVGPLDRWLDVYASPAGDDDSGQLVFLLSDLSARHAADAALRASDARARLALDIAHVGVYDWDLAAGTAVLDARAGEILGIPATTPAADVPALLAAAVHVDDGARVRAAFEAAADADGTWHVEHRAAGVGGAVRHVVSRGRITYAGDGAARRPAWLLGALLDVTAEREAEAALRESEGRFRHMADSIPQLAWMAEADGSILWYNDRWYDYTGTTLETMQGWGWQAVHHPDHVEAVTARFLEAIASGEAWEDTFPLRGRDGVYRWFLSRASPHRTADGLVSRWFGTNTDVTEQRAAQEALRQLNEVLETRVAERTAEIRDTNAQLEARNRELQDFAHVASHDLQEPLRKIQSFAALIAGDESSALSDEARHYAERTQAAAERMRGLIRDLLAFSRVATTRQPVEPVDLDAALAAVLVDLDVSLAQTQGEVRAGALGLVDGDPLQMRQLLQNLVGNALKYHREGVAPRVTVRTERADGHVRIVVEDNGIGFDARHAERIFAPFQRLHGKHEYEGTGMGLAIVRRIAERHGGTATADGTPGVGSRFAVTLPVR